MFYNNVYRVLLLSPFAGFLMCEKVLIKTCKLTESVDDSTSCLVKRDKQNFHGNFVNNWDHYRLFSEGNFKSLQKVTVKNLHWKFSNEVVSIKNCTHLKSLI